MRASAMRYVRRGGAALLALAASAVVSVGAEAKQGRTPHPIAVVSEEWHRALEAVDRHMAQPVTETILADNALRAYAGLALVGADWTTAPLMLRQSHAPISTVFLDAAGKVAKVVLVDRWLSGEDRRKELDIVDEHLSGKAATWLGIPPLLFQVETYTQDILDHPTLVWVNFMGFTALR